MEIDMKIGSLLLSPQAAAGAGAAKVTACFRTGRVTRHGLSLPSVARYVTPMM